MTQRSAAGLPAKLRAATNKTFPSHPWFLLGEAAALSFLILVATGIYLAVFYEASGEIRTYTGSYEPMVGVEVPAAYASVMDITFDEPLGAWMRQTHHWAALVFVATIVLHAGRVFFTGAFRRPRQLNWLVGLTLMGLAMTTGFFGASLPHDLLGGTGSRIGHTFAVSIPVIGPGIADMLFAGEFANPGMLHRFWVLHVIVLPILIAALLGAHVYLVTRQSHTQFRSGPGARVRATERNVVGSKAVPTHAAKAVALALVVWGALLTMGAALQIAPIWLYGPFDPASATVPAQPDWYLGWVEGSLRIFPSLGFVVAGRELPSPLLTGVALPVAVFVILAIWPWAEARLTGDRGPHHLLDRPRDRPARSALGAAGLTALVVFQLAGSHDLQALMIEVPIGRVTTFYRVLLAVAPATVGVVTYGICRSLVRNERERRGLHDRVAIDLEHAPDSSAVAVHLGTTLDDEATAEADAGIDGGSR